MHFIHGFFCQQSVGLGLVEGGTREGLVASYDMIMFAGQIAHQDHDPTNPLAGLMHDDLIGKAILSDIAISETEIRFLKRYVKGEGFWTELTPEEGILYLLEKGADNTWVGTYTIPPKDGRDPTIGPVRCVVTEVRDELFQADLEKYARAQGLIEMPGPTLFDGPEVPPEEDRPINF